MKKMKIVKTLMIILMLTLVITSTVYATPIDVVEGKINPPSSGMNQANNIRNRVLFIVQLVGSIIAVSMLIILGIKYMVAAPEGKADVKKQALIYIVGAVFLFGSVGIVEIIKNFETNL